MASSLAPCTPSPPRPSPRLKAGGAAVLTTKPDAAHSDFCGATRSSQRCYLPPSRQARSPPSRQPLTARSTRPAGLAASSSRPNWELSTAERPAEGFDGPPLPNWETSTTARAEGFDGPMRARSLSPRSNLVGGAAANSYAGRSLTPELPPGFFFPSSMAIDGHIQRVCEESDGVRPHFDNPGAASLCRSYVQDALTGMEEMEKVIRERRQREYKQVREVQREQAAAWKVRQQKKQKADVERMRLKAIEDEEDRRIQAELQEKHNREQQRERKKSHFRDILEGNCTRKMRRKTEDEVALTKAKPTRASTTITMAPKLAPIPDQVQAPSISDMKRSSVKASNFENFFQKDVTTALSGKLSECIAASSAGRRLGSPTPREASKKPSESCDQRVEKLRRAGLLRSAMDKRAGEEEARCAKYDCIPEDERLILKAAFNLYDRAGLGMDLEGMQKALMEIGLAGMSTEEWMILSSTCESHFPKLRRDDHSRPGCDLFRFAVELVPAVRAALLQHRRTELVKTLSRVERDWERGKLVAKGVLEAVLDIFPLETDTAEPEQCVESVKELVGGYVDDEHNLMDYVNKLQELAEAQQRKASEAQQGIKREFELSLQTFEMFRPYLQPLHVLFGKLDANGNDSGLVGEEEVVFVLKELDMIPSQADSVRVVSAMQKVKEACPADFNSFMELVREIEDIMEPLVEQRIPNIKRYFDEHQRDTDSVIPCVLLEDVETIFGKLGIRMQNFEDRSAMRRVLAKADMEGKGQLTLETVKRLYLCVIKRFKQAALLRQYQIAESNHFGISELREINEVFTGLDSDGSGTLDVDEVREAARILNLNLGSNSHFEVGFAMLDRDMSGALDFEEFMQFLRMVRDKEGPFKVARLTRAPTVNSLDRFSLFLLMECLDEENSNRDHTGTKKEKVRMSLSMSVEDLVQKACSELDVDPAVSLEATFGVTTLQDLMEHAKHSRATKGAGSSVHHAPKIIEDPSE